MKDCFELYKDKGKTTGLKIKEPFRWKDYENIFKVYYKYEVSFVAKIGNYINLEYFSLSSFHYF